MRLWFAALAVVALAGIGACGQLAGLSSFTLEDCSDGTCDASVHPPPGTDAATSDGNVSPGDDDAGDDGGCPLGQVCDGGCLNACPSVDGGCIDYTSDPANCGGCGAACVSGQACIGSICGGEEGGTPPQLDASVPCPDGGCPNSVGTSYTCPFGACNGSSSTCSGPSGCFCSNDNLCLSGKCVQVAGENDQSCGGHCTGTGGRDGFDCQLASPGIPPVNGGGFACPAGSGFKNTTLSCDPSHTNCYCTADNECPSGKCVPSSNNGNCSGAGPCSGSGSPDYRGCTSIASVGSCPIYIGCPSNSKCSYPTCYCTSDVACASGKCIPSSSNGNCSGCTGTKGAKDDGHGCQVPPSSVACGMVGGSSCTTSLTPAPVLNSDKTACLCVADSNCSSGKCVNGQSQCSGTCTGSGEADNNSCLTASAVANSFVCALGSCSTVTSPGGTCSAAGVPCWCTSDAQCGGGHCATWAGCAAGACTGAGTGNPFHCVP